jgi:hypothetical protein
VVVTSSASSIGMKPPYIEEDSMPFVEVGNTFYKWVAPFESARHLFVSGGTLHRKYF